VNKVSAGIFLAIVGVMLLVLIIFAVLVAVQ
jgi:hypothetical protein